MKYKVKIFLESDMCMGSGESKGNAVDRDICVDKYGLPYIPARRMKGCLRSTAEFLLKNGFPTVNETLISELFGNAFGEDGSMIIDDAVLENAEEIHAVVRSIEKEKAPYLKTAVSAEAIENLFTAVRGQTRLEDGVKVDGTLRSTRVLTRNNLVLNEDKPVVFVSGIEIMADSKEKEALLEACLKGTRHIGSSRNRGYGNITIQFEKETEKINRVMPKACQLESEREYFLDYKLYLDSPVTIPGFDDVCTAIPARSIIGLLAGMYAKEHGADASFDDLFLNGCVKWSAITPVISGRTTIPAPLFIHKLKNGGGRIVNVYAEKGTDWKSLKPKSMDGSYAAETDNGFEIADVSTVAQYHNSIEKQMLYTQEAIDAGYVYGGRVSFPGKYYSVLSELLCKATLRFGRSKNVQYSNCHLISIGAPETVDTGRKTAEGAVYVVLQSDMVLNDAGVYLTDTNLVKDYLAKELQLSLSDEPCKNDMVSQTVLAGFQNMWHLQKMQITAVKAGSVFCFQVNKCEIPTICRIGAYQQEGLGLVRTYTEEEMKSRMKLSYTDVDTLEKEADEEKVTIIRNALVKTVVRDTLLQYARYFRMDSDKKVKAEIPFSRLRLMLQTSDSFKAFCEKVETIKESDVSSENRGRKAAAKEFITAFYGGMDMIHWEKLLASQSGLHDAVAGNRAMLDTMWKIPMMEVIHAKGGKQNG